jgi:hypothetical protein
MAMMSIEINDDESVSNETDDAPSPTAKKSSLPIQIPQKIRSYPTVAAQRKEKRPYRYRSP